MSSRKRSDRKVFIDFLEDMKENDEISDEEAGFWLGFSDE